MNILITGGAGFIGSNLAEFYQSKNHKVIIIDNLSSGNIENISFLPKNNFIEADIQDNNTLEKLFDEYNFDIIFHLAAVVSVVETIEDPFKSQKVNIESTLNLLKIIKEKNKGLKRFIFASSAAVYGNVEGLPKNMDSLISPESPYAIEKFAGEQYSKLFNKLYGVPTTGFRFFNVYGPKQNPNSTYSGVISIMQNCFENNKTFTFYGDGTQTRDFVYIKDLISAIDCAINNEITIGKTYNLGTGVETSLNKIFSEFEKIYNKKINVEYKEFRKGDIKNSVSDITPLIEQGYKPQFGISEGLESYVNFCNNNFKEIVYE